MPLAQPVGADGLAHRDASPGEDRVQRCQEGHDEPHRHFKGQCLGRDAKAGQVKVDQVGQIIGEGVGCQRPQWHGNHQREEAEDEDHAHIQLDNLSDTGADGLHDADLTYLLRHQR